MHLKANRALSAIGTAVAVLALVMAVLPTPKAAADTILESNVNVCTTIGGYCFTSNGVLHDPLVGDNGGGSGNSEQDSNIELSTACGGYVKSGCPFDDSTFNTKYAGYPIVVIYMHNGSNCAVDDGIQTTIYLAVCSANAAEYVSAPVEDGAAFDLINVWATNGIDNPNLIYYACTQEGNGQSMFNDNVTSGNRCVWKYIPQD